MESDHSILSFSRVALYQAETVKSVEHTKESKLISRTGSSPVWGLSSRLIRANGVRMAL